MINPEHQKMGYSYFLKVIGECSLQDLIGSYRNKLLCSKDKEWLKNVPQIDMKKFFNNITEIEFANFEFNIFHFDRDDEEDENGIDEYAKFLFFDFLLQDGVIAEWSHLFNQVEYISVDAQGRVEITIAHKSSYKGSGELDIYFLEIYNDIVRLKELCPTIKVYSKLGQS